MATDAGFARLYWRARIETPTRKPTAGLWRGSPVFIGGRGLKRFLGNQFR